MLSDPFVVQDLSRRGQDGMNRALSYLDGRLERKLGDVDLQAQVLRRHAARQPSMPGISTSPRAARSGQKGWAVSSSFGRGLPSCSQQPQTQRDHPQCLPRVRPRHIALNVYDVLSAGHGLGAGSCDHARMGSGSLIFRVLRRRCFAARCTSTSLGRTRPRYPHPDRSAGPDGLSRSDIRRQVDVQSCDRS